MKPQQKQITGNMRVWTVIRRHPETLEVFRRHGCPDMRKGISALSARVMKVRWTARAHKIDADVLVRELNEAVPPGPEPPE